LQLIVLGCHSPFPPAGGACPGYLVEHGGEHVLLECGSGVLARLQRYLPLQSLRHVVLSHLHSDHCSDLAVLRYAFNGRDVRVGAVETLTICAPDQAEEEFARLAYREYVRSRAVGPADQLVIGPFSLAFSRTQHAAPCLAVRLRAGNRTLVYTGDAALTGELVDFCRGADLLLAEASLLERDAAGRVSGHMTAADTGLLASRAGVERLMLTHFWPGYHREELRSEAAGTFAGELLLAEEGRVYLV